MIASTLALSGLLIATAGHYLMVRRRGHDRRRRHVDDWDSAISQARAVQRLEDLAERDQHTPG